MKARPNIKYRFYPSLLGAFQEYVDTDPETFFFQDENGAWHRNYDESNGTFHLSDEEVDAIARQRLLDSINRVGTISEAADKGSCFNEILDCIIKGVKGTRDDIHISKKDSIIETKDGITKETPIKHIEATMDGFVFRFDIDFCKQAADYFRGSMCQVFTKAPIRTSYGDIELYGFADYLRENKVFDAKTTSKYQWGKYEKGWQKHAYPYCLIESGKCTDIAEFEYTVFVLSGGNSRSALIQGSMMRETYTYNHEASTSALRLICERFVEFLEANKEYITNRKIFNQE